MIKNLLRKKKDKIKDQNKLEKSSSTSKLKKERGKPVSKKYFIDSCYSPNFLSDHGYDPLEFYKELSEEVESLYIPRDKIQFKIYGKSMSLARDKCIFGDVKKDGSTPLYRYGSDYNPKVNDWVPTVKLVRDLIEKETGQHCNHCVLNRYRDGSDYIGYHRDKIRDVEEGTNIYTVSFGTERVLKFKKQKTKEVTDVSLKPGSLFSIGFKTNEAYKHSIPKSKKIHNVRISLTLRTIKTWQSKGSFSS